MQAGKAQPSRAQRRIIDRPRLIKLLDESEARVILLLAPAGYGKTTLARQWARTLNRSRVIWQGCAHGHEDVVTFALDLADLIDAAGVSTARDVREYVSAQSNPQRSSRKIATILAEHLNRAEIQWVVLDDYHELGGTREVEDVVDILVRNSACRFVVTSRERPTWATSRRILYGEIVEITRDALAMNDDESRELLGTARGSADLVRRAAGWPAVLALAADADDMAPPATLLPSALHGYFAEELFERASVELQDRLVRLALLPVLAPAAIEEFLRVDDASNLLQTGAKLGFVRNDDTPTLHPLLREFLLGKLAERPDARARIYEAVDFLIENEQWDWALELVSRFSCEELVEPVLQQSFKPLARNGQIATLASFAKRVRSRPTFPPAPVDLVEAEVSLRDGALALAEDLARRAESNLATGSPLRSRASAIRGHSHLQSARFHEAELAFADARRCASDNEDEIEAIHGIALARIMGERADARNAVDELLVRRHESPTLLVRAVTAEIARRRFSEGIAASLPIDEARHALPQVEDPRVRTSFAYTVAYALGQRAEYATASEWLTYLAGDVESFDLEFARPHLQWVMALVRLGLRKFGEAERLLQTIEDAMAGGQLSYQQVNAHTLRARLLLETGKASEAVELTSETPDPRNYPSWRAEYIATRALALACTEDPSALEASHEAEATSGVVEVRVLAEAARAVVHSQQGNLQEALKLLSLARSLGAWDPVLCALRASQSLGDLLVRDQIARRDLQVLYSSSNDLGLARRAGFRVRATRGPGELLTPREMEVLGLVARGMKTAEIARALFISPSTAKVHIRHMLEKLGVRTRAEAVARYEMFTEAG